MISTCVLIIMVMGLANGYPKGAPLKSCSSMSPNHKGTAAQTPQSSPYTVSLSATSFSCGETLTVTLNGSSLFEGFLCQARPDPAIYATSGQLTRSGALPDMKNTCGAKKAALTHTENGDKTTAIFIWTPPTTDMKNVYFVCTVVKNKATYWEKVKSDVLTYDSTTTCSS